MWINKAHYEALVRQIGLQEQEIRDVRSFNAQAVGFREALTAQKAKDDVTIDWMRHRINALEKTNTVLLQKVAGVHLPTPEIVPTRPGTMTHPDFDHMPSFEDVGDEEAARLGLRHDEEGRLEFIADMKQQGHA